MSPQEILKCESVLDQLKKGKPTAKQSYATIKVHGGPRKKIDFKEAPWKTNGRESACGVLLDSKAGPVLHLLAPTKESDHLMPPSLYTHFRDEVGAGYPKLKEYGLQALVVEFIGTSEEEELGVLVGLGLATYEFATYKKISTKLPALHLVKEKGSLLESTVKEAGAIAQGANLARHLVNLPPQELNPKSYAEAVQQYFGKKKGVTVEVWNEARLRKEKMGLITAVGQGAEHGPCMVRIKYRPVKAKAQAPCVFVGKGITFDSGGLDIKPSQFMRWMKKDMGGSASVVGLASWVVDHKLTIPCDFYLAIAENAIDAKSSRPGDVYTAKNGVSVEIHNTDAEGRLALADVLVVATEQKEKPRFIVDFATLTGAMKVGLGADLAGFFSTDTKLTASVKESSLSRGDLTWEMPLFEGYDSMLASSFADVVNSADGYGGAITAALFLKKFIGSTPWMHFDIYAWNDRPKGALQSVGGNGQMVQLWSHLLTTLE